MVLADKATYFRRFTVKFVEIVAAGIGTAVSGYVVAYVTGHLSWFTPAAVKPGAPAPQAISTPVEPKQAVASAEPKNTEPKNAESKNPESKNLASIEATVRAALASHHDVSEAATPASVPASPVAVTTVPATPAVETAPPLATTEIKSVPVAAAVDPAQPAEPDGWPSDPGPMRTGSSRLPPQPPPVNINVLGALKRLF